MNPEPFDLSPEIGAAAGALCIHGLTATPAEVRPVGELLARRGFRAVGPTLPGHHRTVEALLSVKYEAWLEVVHGECDKLRADHDAVFLVGSSLGGLLSLAVAAEVSVDGLAVVGPPLDFGWHRSWVPGVLRHVRTYLPKRDGPGILDPVARKRHVSYEVMPVASVHQLIRLQRVVRAALGRIRAPILVAYGEHDQTASPDDAKPILAGVSSVEKQHLVLPNSSHIATLDYDGPQLCEAIVRFFEAQLSSSRASAGSR